MNKPGLYYLLITSGLILFFVGFISLFVESIRPLVAFIPIGVFLSLISFVFIDKNSQNTSSRKLTDKHSKTYR